MSLSLQDSLKELKYRNLKIDDIRESPGYKYKFRIIALFWERGYGTARILGGPFANEVVCWNLDTFRNSRLLSRNRQKATILQNLEKKIVALSEDDPNRWS